MKKLLGLAAFRLFRGSSLLKMARRFAVASVLVIAVAFVLGAPAPACAGQMNQVKLYPPADGLFPNASGQYQVSYSEIYPPGPTSYLNSLSVSKLAPNTSYYIPLYFAQYSRDEHGYPIFIGWVLYKSSFQTDARGAYKSPTSKAPYGAILYALPAVYDSSTGTPVLTAYP